jgi:PEP-CTERM motif
MRNWLVTCAALVAFSVPFVAGGPAQAIVPGPTIDVTQVGANVVMTGSGVIDLSGLTLEDSDATWPFPGELFPSLGVAVLGLGGSGVNIDIYSGASGPATLGTGENSFIGSTATGDVFGIDGNGHGSPTIFVPTGYDGTTLLSGSSTFDNTTLAAIGLTPGTYTYTWAPSSTATDGSLTVVVSGVIPEPSTWAMMLLGFVGFGLLAYRNRRTGTLAAA